MYTLMQTLIRVSQMHSNSQKGRVDLQSLLTQAKSYAEASGSSIAQAYSSATASDQAIQQCIGGQTSEATATATAFVRLSTTTRRPWQRPLSFYVGLSVQNCCLFLFK